MSGQWIRDGRYLLGEADVENVQSKWVIGYDTNEQAYRYVRFASPGQIEENDACQASRVPSGIGVGTRC